MVNFTDGSTEWNIDRGTSRKSTPRIIRYQFGDGYEQRALQGINALDEVFSLSFRNRTKNEIDNIVGFFESNQGISVFAFKSPEMGELQSPTDFTNLQFTASSKEIAITGGNFNTLNTPSTPERLIILDTTNNNGDYTVDFSGTNDSTTYTVLETLTNETDAACTIAAAIGVTVEDWTTTFSYGEYWSLNATFKRRYEP